MYDSGQHISFYQRRTLKMLADAVCLNYYKSADDLHVLTDRALQPLELALYRNERLLRLWGLWLSWRRRKLLRRLATGTSLQR
jgi:hypothetical protein